MREAARRLNDLLDEALAQTFPASDPVAITVRDPPRHVQRETTAAERLESPRTQDAPT